VARVGNDWLAYSPALHILRESGMICQLLDLLDERRLRPGEAATLASLLLDGGEEPLPDWKHEPQEFAAALTTRAAGAGNAFDARRRRLVPLVDAQALLKAMRSESLAERLLPWLLIAAVVVGAIFIQMRG